jgi:ribosomal protein S18 acetylase RimI-like enzyme
LKILIDTNILINLEDNKIIQKEFAEFYQIAISNKCSILYHPKAIPEDLSNDRDNDRREIILSKLAKYQKIQNFDLPTEEFLSEIGNTKSNDKIDNKQLYQVYVNYADYFVTEDRGIHSKAKRFNISAKVLKIEEALNFLEERYQIIIPTHPILRESSIRKIKHKFETSFFDSLREDYGKTAFNNWINKCATKDRKCYYLLVGDELRAILIYNEETVEDHRLNDVFQNALKICTLKVESSAFGIKLGELFLNKMFEYCINQDIGYLYLSVYEKQTHLIYLLEKFGFYKEEFLNGQGNKELKMIKRLVKSLVTDNENLLVNHPFYRDGADINKYVIPIQPQFYNTLFKDGKHRSPTLFDASPWSLNEIQGNTIIKAYISNSNIKKLSKGDILLFYSSKERKSIEPIGILEECQIVDNIDDLWDLVRKKTVFTRKQLESMLYEKKSLHVIVFRLITYMQKEVNLDRIKRIDSLKNKIQTITHLKQDDYKELKDEGYFDRRYIID